MLEVAAPQVTGDLAESLVNYQIMERGFPVVVASAGHAVYDLLVDMGRYHPGKFLRVQVKGAASAPVKKPNSYHFSCLRSGARDAYAANAVDYFAFAALDIQKVLFIPAVDVVSSGKTQVIIHRKKFDADDGDSLDRMLGAA